MEPVLGGRDDPALSGSAPRLRVRRNGARPWRTGRLFGCRDHPSTILVPQWSPSLADGTTPGPVRPEHPLSPAAMEPVLGGRDDPSG